MISIKLSHCGCFERCNPYFTIHIVSMYVRLWGGGGGPHMVYEKICSPEERRNGFLPPLFQIIHLKRYGNDSIPLTVRISKSAFTVLLQRSGIHV